MAKGNDIGAYISLHVRKNQQQLGQEIQSAVDSVNRKIKINITKFAISNDALAGLNTRIQNHLKNKTFNLNVSVKKIDATEAINNVKMELARMVEAFRLDNGVNLKGIGNFTDGAYQKGADASAKAAATVTAAVKEKAAADAQELEIAEATTQQEKAQVDLLNQINILKKEAATFAQNNPAFIGSDNSEHKNINQLLSDIEALKVSTTRMNAASKEELQEQQLAYSKLREQLSKYKAEQQEASNAVANSNLVRRDKIMLGASSLGSTLSGLEGKALGLQGSEAVGFVEQIRTLQTEVTKLHKIASQTSGEEKATMEELESRLRTLTDQAKQLGIALGQTARTDPSKVSPNTVSAGKQYSIVTSLNNKITAAENLLSNNTKLSGTQTGANIRKLVSSYESLRNQALLTTNMTSEGWAKLRNEIKANDEQMAQARIEMERYGLKGHSVLGKISEGIKRFGGWMLITHSIMSAIRAMKQAVSNVKEIDAAMTQLKIVTGATDQEMAQFSDTAFAMAQNLGKSVTEITKSIETFSRLGYNLQDSSELAKYATIMSNVADVSGEEATKGITSIIKGFNLDVADAEHVADILISVGQSYAVSASEMMEAYEKSGAALNATNTSLEKSAGLIAAANSSVQDASVVGKWMPSLAVM